MELPSLRSAWLEIDLGTIRKNITYLKRRINPRKLLAVVKDNAYGHGAIEVSRVAIRAGADYLGVVNAGEAIELREAGIEKPILVLSPVENRDAGVLGRWNLAACVCDYRFARTLSKIAVRYQGTIGVHLKVDTGMTRLGVDAEDAARLAGAIAALQGIELQGIFTHLALAYDPKKKATLQQLKVFNSVVNSISTRGIKIPIVHAANSAAIAFFPQAWFDMVRPGLAIYGLTDSPAMAKELKLSPALSFKTKVMMVREVGPGRGVSYGFRYVTPKRMKIAVVGVGYGDGYPRILSNRAKIIIRKKKLPQIGTICMDTMMVDVSSCPDVGIGDEVVLIGSQGEVRISAEELAELAGTIPYEIVCGLNQRLPRIYMGER